MLAAAAQAQTLSADSVLERVQSALDGMQCYSVEFTIGVEDSSARGEYVVCGRDFYVTTDDVDVYVMGKVKHEVDRKRREIQIEDSSSLGSDIVSNPADAFDAMRRNYKATLSTKADRLLLELEPRPASKTRDRVEVEVDASSYMPSAILYHTQAGVIKITVLKIRKESSVPQFSAQKYPGFEIFDLR